MRPLNSSPMKLPASSVLLAYSSPPTEPDFISLALCNAKGEAAEGWQVNEGDDDWKFMQEFFHAVEYQVKGVDSLLKDVEAFLQTTATPFGVLRHVRPAVTFSETPASWARPSVPLGTHAPEWWT